ncbi:hypothetical protein O1W17_32965 [Streptomyces sp. H34-S5]|nr:MULTISPECIES: hypothetical protein [unclassified Streptomyces]MCY0944145.1 hypothetical protein [Streptomyces sp. H34-AA3]MCZ4086739.1 hypothetical protein [Streptomyces sp. H34-S5]
MTWSWRSGRTAVPMAKNSVVCDSQLCECCLSWTATIPSASRAFPSACMRLIASSRAS